jgi:hypothetical protein
MAALFSLFMVVIDHYAVGASAALWMLSAKGSMSWLP